MPSNPSLGRPVVLAVDDKRANLLALDALLGELYSMVLVTSGAEAIAIVRDRDDIDLILMDVQMPGMDGFEASRQIKALAAGRGIPIILVTAVHGEDPWVKRGYDVGAVDYFTKPFDPKLLRMKVAVYTAFTNRERYLAAMERHVAEAEELLRVGRKLSSMLESLEVGVLIADAEGRICQSTQEAARIFRSTEQMEHDSYGELLGWWDTAGRLLNDEGTPLARVLSGRHSSHSQPLEIQACDGSTVSIVASASPLHGLDKRFVGAVVLIQDVTEQRRIESTLEERVTRLIDAGLELEESAVRNPAAQDGERPQP
jgi:CheY-like chemotaxis protein